MAGSVRTAYDEKDEPLLDDVWEEGGEGVLIGRLTSQRACRFAARPSAVSAPRAACLKAYIFVSSLLNSIIPSRR